ncbi:MULTISPECIES: DUF1328 domain-containing protein [Haloferax]|uniref:UPF0391 membrane protein BN996_02455 n=1 Tax=Haloferax massiliensis TaxID=1476858 RepID=A0A0D6JT02_9EURY|nr:MULTISPECIES: DUF1328 domain-containing protein [Haloferax]MDS0242062.1 DUF1328 domain-containing protein [Haloferax sp. S2CR25]MDS0445183.1 DUF1328 domain-containing protein [Haloferax sp. S2CR25-2]CQR50969.1 hypothetical protein BN996_02455 [Haloferax massiliensis]
MTLASLAALGMPASAPLQAGGGGLLYYGIVFFVLAIVAGLAGFRGVAGLSMKVARILVVVFLVLAIVTFLL